MVKKAVLFVIIIVIAYTVVSITTGSPIKRVQFRSNVTDYLHKTYTMNWKIDSVDYDFKRDNFSANVTSKSGTSFIVEDFNGQIIDNYASSVWRDELKTAVAQKVKQVTGSDAEVIINVSHMGRDALTYHDEVPSYSKVSQKLSSEASIYIKGNFSATRYLQEMLEIKQWIVEKKYDASLTFEPKDKDVYFYLPTEDLKKIKKPEDLNPYRLQNN